MITAAVVFDFLGTSTKNILMVIGILICTVIIQRIVSKLLSNSFKKSSKLLNVDETSS